MIEGPQGRLHLAVDDAGAATPVLFVHSDAGTLHHWDEVRAHYRGKRPTAAFDRRGHGKSDFPLDWSLDPVKSVGDIDAAAEGARFLRFVLVGHSGGALTALAYAHHAPQRLAGLVLVDPPPDPRVLPPGLIEKTLEDMRGPNAIETIEGYYRTIAGEDASVRDRVVKDAAATRSETVIGTFEGMAAFKPAEQVGRYKGPALAIIQPEYDVEGALHRIGGWPHLAIGGAGHWIHLGPREKFLAALDGFLAKVDG
jgi:pimeloyl-ACP methyl ester carboxylesterase